jgi:hypothetical protein
MMEKVVCQKLILNQLENPSCNKRISRPKTQKSLERNVRPH